MLYYSQAAQNQTDGQDPAEIPSFLVLRFKIENSIFQVISSFVVMIRINLFSAHLCLIGWVKAWVMVVEPTTVVSW